MAADEPGMAARWRPARDDENKRRQTVENTCSRNCFQNNADKRRLKTEEEMGVHLRSSAAGICFSASCLGIAQGRKALSLDVLRFIELFAACEEFMPRHRSNPT